MSETTSESRGAKFTVVFMVVLLLDTGCPEVVNRFVVNDKSMYATNALETEAIS